LIVAPLAGAITFAPRSAHAQSAHARFDIDSITDSTFTFVVGRAHWVARGQTGLAVDPAHDDELIAEFRVVQVERGVATAFVTGQTARVKTGHVAVMEPPGRAFYRQPLFWAGAVAGGIIGFVAHTH
jgi:hypothetical protein